MATFIIKDLRDDTSMYYDNKRGRTLRQAEFFRLHTRPCYVIKKFSKAGHPHIARIEYDSNLRGWAERESINCDQYGRRI